MCTRPIESRDNDCKTKNGKPAFRCNYFEIKVDGKIPEGSCIPLVENKGLKDLTVRCAKATSSWLKSHHNSILSLEKDKYDEFINKLEYHLDGFETSRPLSGKKSFLEYCGDHSKDTTNGLQNTECNVMINLILQLKQLKNIAMNNSSSDSTNTKCTSDCPDSNQ
jgi:hypothetical protein